MKCKPPRLRKLLSVGKINTVWVNDPPLSSAVLLRRSEECMINCRIVTGPLYISFNTQWADLLLCGLKKMSSVIRLGVIKKPWNGEVKCKLVFLQVKRQYAWGKATEVIIEFKLTVRVFSLLLSLKRICLVLFSAVIWNSIRIDMWTIAYWYTAFFTSFISFFSHYISEPLVTMTQI